VTSSSIIRWKRRRSGFTLVETLVALALAAIIASFLSGGIVFGRRVWEKSAERDAVIEGDSLRDALKAITQGAIRHRMDPDTPILAFKGDVSSLAFVTLGDPSVETGGVQDVRLEVVDIGVEGKALGYVATPKRRSPSTAHTEPSRQPLILVRGTGVLRFRYFGRRGESEKMEWFDRWLEQAELPTLIEISIVFKERRTPPISLVVAVPAGGG
jgi:prepilin-type N-terminal cleavage/methylation domain-containing protein